MNVCKYVCLQYITIANKISCYEKFISNAKNKKKINESSWREKKLK